MAYLDRNVYINKNTGQYRNIGGADYKYSHTEQYDPEVEGKVFLTIGIAIAAVILLAVLYHLFKSSHAVLASGLIATPLLAMVIRTIHARKVVGGESLKDSAKWVMNTGKMVFGVMVLIAFTIWLIQIVISAF